MPLQESELENVTVFEVTVSVGFVVSLSVGFTGSVGLVGSTTSVSSFVLIDVLKVVTVFSFPTSAVLLRFARYRWILLASVISILSLESVSYTSKSISLSVIR